MSVPERLRSLAGLFKERAKTYGDQYANIGNVLWDIYGGPVTIETAHDFTRFVTFAFVVQKLCRYSNTFENGGHADSLDDMAVYAQMLRELDDNMA